MSSERNDIYVKRFVVGSIEANAYVVFSGSGRHGVLIDPGFYDKKINDYIEDNSINMLYTINTHGHADHIGANAEYPYPVLIHTDDRGYLSDPGKNLSGIHGYIFPESFPSRELEDNDIVDVVDFKLKVIHTPGHTPGCICILCGNILFSGDTLFFEGVGRTDLPGGDRNKLSESIKNKLFVMPDTVRVLPGHGPETTIGHEKKYNPFL